MRERVIRPDGFVKVRRRDPASPEGVARFLPEDADDAVVEFPIGPDLVREVKSRFDTEQMAESTMIRRYADEQGVRLVDVISELIGPDQRLGEQTVQRFLTNTGLKPFFSPIVEDGLRTGLERVESRWQGLIARTIQVDQMKYEYYEFNNGSPNVANPGQPLGTAEVRMKSIGQGAPIPTARISVGTKSYTLYKSGRGIEWTDEARSAPIDLAAMYFEQVGMQLGWDYHDQIIEMLLDGYHDDGSDDAPVVTTTTPGVITDADLFRAIGTMQTVYGYDPDVMILPLATSIGLRTLENGAGQRIFPSGLAAAGLPREQIAATIPADKIVLVDTDFALVRFVYREFGTEFDRNVQTQTEGSYGTEVSLTVPLFSRARVVLDS